MDKAWTCERLQAEWHTQACVKVSDRGSRRYNGGAVRCSREPEDSVRQRQGSVSLDKRSKTWNFFYWENGKRRSKKIGATSQFPTKQSAWRAAKPLRDAVENRVRVSSDGPTVATLIEQYRMEKMPPR